MTDRINQLVDAMDRDSFMTLYYRNLEVYANYMRNVKRMERLLKEMRQAGIEKFGIPEEELVKEKI